MQELIYNQRGIPREQWRYGFRASADIGCGWVAVYNALCILGKTVDIPDLIRSFERQIPLVNGTLGSFIGTPALLLRQKGYAVRILADRRRFDETAKQYPVCILSYYWKRNHRVGAHFVALRWTGDHFEGYNTYTTSVGPDNYGPSITRFLKRRGYFAPVLTVISEKEQKQLHT